MISPRIRPRKHIMYYIIHIRKAITRKPRIAQSPRLAIPPVNVGPGPREKDAQVAIWLVLCDATWNENGEIEGMVGSI